jgi:hypothetical protein
LASASGRTPRTHRHLPRAHTSFLADADAAYLWLLSPVRRAEGGTWRSCWKTPSGSPATWPERLRERIYDDVVPPLARGSPRRAG